MKATTKITRKPDGEFRVRLFIDGRYQPGVDYFTDDREDAEATADAMRDCAQFSDRGTEFAQDELQDYEDGEP